MENGLDDITGPVVRFDATQPLTYGRERSYGDADDPGLTAFVMGLWHELQRRSTPVPPCPHCGGFNTRLHNRPNDHHTLPHFRCSSCRRTYSRLTGTPLARLRFVQKMPRFIELLSQPIPLEEASRRLDMDYGALSNWLMRFRELIAQHDPDGRWTARVQLGIRYKPEGTCPQCGYTGVLSNGGFSSDNRRRAMCPQCRRAWPVYREVGGSTVAVSVVLDLAVNAAHRRKLAGQDAPELPAIRRAVLVVPPRTTPETVEAPDVSAPEAGRFDFSRRLRTKRPLPASFEEDQTLTAFLSEAISKVFSDSFVPPSCPHCAGSDTRLAVRPRPQQELPRFQCRQCTRIFTRATRTPMANMLRRDMLFAFLPWLSCQRPLAHAAEALGTTPDAVKAWVRRFRQWLLVLDPSGQYEKRVRLGLKAP